VVRSSADIPEDDKDFTDPAVRTLVEDMRTHVRANGALSLYKPDEGGALIVIGHKAELTAAQIASQLKDVANQATITLCAQDVDYGVYVTRDLVYINLSALRPGATVKVVNGTGADDAMFKLMAPNVIVSYIGSASENDVVPLKDNDDVSVTDTQHEAASTSHTTAKTNDNTASASSSHATAGNYNQPNNSNDDFWKSVNA